MKEFYEDKRVLVTGGSGFIGKTLVKRLEEMCASVVSLERSNSRQPEILITGVCNQRTVMSVFARHKPQVVFHLAAQTEVRKSFEEPYQTYLTNVLGTLNVLEACRVHGVEAVVISSSDKAYGQKEPYDMPYKESMRLCTNGDIYACSKRCADDLCHDYGRVYRLPIRVLRCANTYGPGQTNATTLITGTIQRLIKGIAPVIYQGCETVRREWLYIDDAVEAYLLAGQDAGKPCKGIAYNVGSECVLTVAEVVASICEEFGYNDVQYQQAISSAPQIGDQWLDSTQFRNRFPDWKPTPFTEGLRKTIAWHQENKA